MLNVMKLLTEEKEEINQTKKFYLSTCIENTSRTLIIDSITRFIAILKP